ncbi:MAG: hypothetical protein J7L89_10355 [Bacteroidales bacterium]|nr:hypothetical protein [Bacteroidales bacterium]
MTFQNSSHPCIRLRTSDISNLKPFIEEYQKLGIRFFSDRKVTPYNSFIQFKKFIKFVKMEKGIYHDKEDPSRYFIRIPTDMEFDEFEKLIAEVKNNCNFHLFDASLVYVNLKNEVIDMVAVYSDHCDESRLPELKKHLEDKIKLKI